jgi:hypothetical protein
MNVTLPDQLLIARQAIEERRRKREEEDQKDLDALERVARLLASSPAPPPANGAQAAKEHISASKDHSVGEEGAASDSDAPQIITTVLEAVLSRPNVSLSPRMILEMLESQNFQFSRDEGKRIFSVAQALRKLTERDQPQVRLVRRGSGRRPNMYRAIVQEINPAHITTATRLSEMTQ